MKKLSKSLSRFVCLFVIMTSVVLTSWGQEISISGTVIDQKTGETVPGASVVVEGTSVGSVTDMDGRFQISAQNDATLLVSFIGYTTQVVGVNNQTDITVKLAVGNTMLDDVIVVGYGTQKKENLTGAVASVNVQETLEARPITDVGRGLQGVTPGVTISTTTGDLGASPTIKIRGGNNSLSGSSSPLILVDNVEIPDLMMVNPDDIASISILKDAASASIYGTRASSGVILITTKRGKARERVAITYTNNFAWKTPTTMPEMADGDVGVDMAFQAMQRVNPNTNSFSVLGMAVNENSAQKMREWEEQYGDQDLGSEMVLGRDFEQGADGKWYFYRPWDVKELFLKTWTPQQSHNISLNGGSEKTSFNLSLGFLDQTGSLKIKEDKYNRYNVTLGVNSDLTDWFKGRAQIMISKSDLETPYSYSGTKADPWYYLLRWPVFYPYGTYEGKDFRSSITDVKQANMIETSKSMVRATLGGTATINEDLTIDASYTYTKNDDHIYTPGGYAEGYNFWGSQGINNYHVYSGTSHNMVRYESNWDATNTFKAYATYNKTFGEDHVLKAMVGTDAESYIYTYQKSERRDLIDITKPEIPLATGDQYVGGDREQWATLGFFGRVNYSYKDKVLLEANGRYDGSSNFPTSNRWGFFPSGSIGYRVSEESYWESIKPVVSNFKLRASYGSIGYEDVGEGVYIPTMSTSNSNWIVSGSDKLTISTPKVVPATLTWETITTLDFGLDATMLDDKLGVTFDWYKTVTTDMISTGETLPSTFGASAPKTNSGEITKKGWELTLDFHHRFDNNLNLSVTASIADNQSEITKYASNSKYIYSNYEGKNIGEIWGYETDRLFQESDFQKDASGEFLRDENNHYVANEGIASQSLYENSWFFYGPGDVKYTDIDGDNEITYGTNSTDDHGDLKVIGNSTPRYEYNFTVAANWKGFDVSAFFQGVGKRDVWATGPVFIPGYRPGEGWYKHQQDFWTPENTDAFYARPTNHDWQVSARNYMRQSRYLLDMSYLRCKNVTLGYSLSPELISKAKLTKARIYMSGENLFEISNTSIPVDPETGDRDGAYSFAFGRSYPYSRTISVGIQVSL